MAMADGLRIEIHDEPVLAVLGRLMSAATNPGPALGEMGAALEGNASLRFKDKRDPTGLPWAPWSASTAEQRREQGKGELLRFDGLLATSLSYQPLQDGVAVGFGQNYAVFHEFGAPKNRMPRRGLLFADPEAGTLGEEDEATVLEILEAHFREAVHG